MFAVLACLPGRPGAVPELLLTAPDFALAAGRHGVAGWILDGLDRLPPDVHRELSAHARDAFGQASKIKRLTTKVLDVLAERRVTPVMLKGSVLASRLYPKNPLVRPSSDVDVLVRREEVDVTASALGALGLSRFHDAASADHFEDHHHVSFMGPAGLVEVHFRLTNTFGGGLFDDERVRGRTMPFRFEGRDVLVLGPEDEFLYLATHAANHAFMRASWLVDLQQYLRLYPTLDFRLMALRAADAGFLTAASVALGLLERLMGVALPPQAHEAFPLGLARRTVDGLLFSPGRVEAARLATHPLASFGLRLWMVDGPRHAARHVTDGALRFARRAWAKR